MLYKTAFLAFILKRYFNYFGDDVGGRQIVYRNLGGRR